MKATISFTLAAVFAVSTEALRVQNLLGHGAEIEMYRNEEQALRVLHIIDQDGDFKIDAQELQNIIVLAQDQGRISDLEAWAAIVLVNLSGDFFPACIAELLDMFSESNDAGSEVVMQLLHLVEDSVIELTGDMIHYSYDDNVDGTLSGREYIDLTRDYLDAQFDYFLDSWDERSGDNDTMELDEFQGFWEELVDKDNQLRENTLDWHAYSDIV